VAVSPLDQDVYHLSDAADVTSASQHEHRPSAKLRAKAEVDRMMQSEAKANSMHRAGDGETDGAPLDLDALFREADPRQAGDDFKLLDMIDAEREQDREMQSPLALIQSGEGSDEQSYPFVITQQQANRRYKRLHQQKRQLAREKARLKSHTPQLQDRYSDPAAPARLRAELRKFDEENEKKHPNLRESSKRKSQRTYQEELEGHVVDDGSSDDDNDETENKRDEETSAESERVVGESSRRSQKRAETPVARTRAQAVDRSASQPAPRQEYESPLDHAPGWQPRRDSNDWYSRGMANPHNPFF
jgi:hypothetical protein